MYQDNLLRFLKAQNHAYPEALRQIQTGRKTSHWMWYVFPQIKGLGQSETAQFYAIRDLSEAAAYLKHPVLGKHLVQISQALLDIGPVTATELLGSPDDLKLRSSMTLFSRVDGANPVFQKVLDRYFESNPDELTLKLISQQS